MNRHQHNTGDGGQAMGGQAMGEEMRHDRCTDEQVRQAYTR